MNWGKVAAAALLGSAVAAGAGMWYAQEYGFYYEIEADSPAALDIVIQTSRGAVDLRADYNNSIDGTSSPLRWRACIDGADPVPADVTPYPGATPLIGPRWFDCFDARQIGADLESGAARAVLSVSDIRPDVDRVLAVYPDGRVYGWHQYLDKNPERGVMD